MKINAYRVIERAVEEGIAYGHRRAHKHTNTPSESSLFEELHRAIMLELSEIIEWDDETIEWACEEL